MKAYPVDINGKQNGLVRTFDDYRWEQMKIQFGKKLSWVAVPEKKSKPKPIPKAVKVAIKKKPSKKKIDIEDDLGEKNIPNDIEDELHRLDKNSKTEDELHRLDK